jgi:hypothetical protein
MPTTDAPTSFQYFTLSVAIIAAMLSAGSLAVSFIAYRAGGPRVRVRALRLSPLSAEKLEFVVKVTNSGRGPVDIEAFAVWARLAGPSNIKPHEAVKGETCPYRLEGMSAREWRIELSDSMRLPRDMNQHAVSLGLKPYRRARVVAVLGDGRVVKPRFFHAFRVVPTQTKDTTGSTIDSA